MCNFVSTLVVVNVFSYLFLSFRDLLLFRIGAFDGDVSVLFFFDGFEGPFVLVLGYFF